MATKAKLDEALFWYKWYPKDWGSSRRVLRMNLTEKGLYRDLLDICWDKGTIPDDAEQLIEMVGCEEEEFDLAWPRVKKCFTKDKIGNLFNEKIERVRTESSEYRKAKAEAGALGGRKTAEKRAGALQILTDANPMRAGALKRELENDSMVNQDKAVNGIALQGSTTDMIKIDTDQSGSNHPYATQDHLQENQMQPPAGAKGKATTTESPITHPLHATPPPIGGAKVESPDEEDRDIPSDIYREQNFLELALEDPYAYVEKVWKHFRKIYPRMISISDNPRDINTLKKFIEIFIQEDPFWWLAKFITAMERLNSDDRFHDSKNKYQPMAYAMFKETSRIAEMSAKQCKFEKGAIVPVICPNGSLVWGLLNYKGNTLFNNTDKICNLISSEWVHWENEFETQDEAIDGYNEVVNDDSAEFKMLPIYPADF